MMREMGKMMRRRMIKWVDEEEDNIRYDDDDDEDKMGKMMMRIKWGR